MSLTLVFRSKTDHAVGPLTSFRLDGEALRTGDGELIAKHERNTWQINKANYPRIECKGPASIWFERGLQPEISRRFGPSHDLALFDGVVYIGKQVFASFNQEARSWYSHEIGHHWKVMVAESAISAGS